MKLLRTQFTIMELSRVHSELTNHIHVCILFRVDNTLSYTLSVFPNLQTRNAGDLFHTKQTGSTSCLWTIILQMYSGSLTAPAPLPGLPFLQSHTSLPHFSQVSAHMFSSEEVQGRPDIYNSFPTTISFNCLFFFFFRTYRNWIPYISTSLFAYSPFVSLQCKPQEGRKLGWFTGRYIELCEWKNVACCISKQRICSHQATTLQQP